MVFAAQLFGFDVFKLVVVGSTILVISFVCAFFVYFF